MQFLIVSAIEHSRVKVFEGEGRNLVGEQMESGMEGGDKHRESWGVYEGDSTKTPSTGGSEP